MYTYVLFIPELLTLIQKCRLFTYLIQTFYFFAQGCVGDNSVTQDLKHIRHIQNYLELKLHFFLGHNSQQGVHKCALNITVLRNSVQIHSTPCTDIVLIHVDQWCTVLILTATLDNQLISTYKEYMEWHLTAQPGLKWLLTDISLELIFINKIKLPLPGLSDD